MTIQDERRHWDRQWMLGVSAQALLAHGYAPREGWATLRQYAAEYGLLDSDEDAALSVAMVEDVT